ncbi:type VI secretion system lysozyme-like protein [Syntrophus gentianae]|uniref:Type VI secretion system lysozyme-like protein n=1 Tax=Syntrophus gentianae TaxID=43775 RepID=A0A1H7VJD4_9BACT|nr:type VI secretion system baseplate subunit TssE [Syntrophus gentianae]SEM09382.1 type VI secretion system lysozyme-like protein [Syntrophus gentianae]
MTLFSKFGDRSSAAVKKSDIEDIIENLNDVLNTKKGYGSFLPDFGIRDMNEYSSRDQLAAVIMEEVKYNIEHYEPRLQLMKISIEENQDPFRISFKIECRVRDTQKALFMEFNSVYNDFHIKNS